jgi:hypothetical protein
MLTIPLTAGKNQSLKVPIGDQLLTIVIYQNSTGVYMDLYINDALVRESMLCLNLAPMVVEAYHGLNGRLMFEDTQGSNDPDYLGFGGRYQLRFLEPGIDYVIP